MNNIKEIEISNIKNIELVYFYNLEQSPYIGLNIVYDNGKHLDYDYKFEYFNEFLLKVINTYKKEKNNNKIVFLTEDSKEAMDNFASFEKNKTIEEKKLEKNPLYYKRSLDVEFLKEYIKKTIYLFLKCMIDDEIIINDFIGNHDNYVIKYNNDQIISLTLIKSDERNYKFKFRYVDVTSRLFSGEIKFYDELISISYSDVTGDFVGKNIYSTTDESKEIIKYCDNIISYENVDNSINYDLINSYLKLLDLPQLNNIIKTVDNNYLISGVDNNTKYSIHISILENYANVKVKKTYGYYNDKLFIPLEEEKMNINMFLKDNDLTIEKHYLETTTSTGKYKKNCQNKYEYNSYCIVNNSLKEKLNIEQEKKYIKR